MRKNTEDKKSRGEANKSKISPKKKLIIVLISIVALIVVLFAISFAIDKYYDKKESADNAPIDYDFYPADFDEYIYNDADYSNLIENGFISYKDNSTGLTLGIDRDSAAEHGEEAEFMMNLLYSIIDGDAARYNSFFSEAYYENNDKHGEFTMQKLYDVTIIKESSETVSEQGSDYTKYTFVLEYKILKNNGTFRNDIGDGSKKQYITVTDRDGKLLIDSLATAKIVSK